jgi:hypothetical protein
MKRSLVFLTVLCLLLGCATYPPPKIEGNRYENYRHGFALELPGVPWEPTDKLPAWSLIAADVPTSKIQLALFNNQTNAFIMVICDRKRMDTFGNDYNAFFNRTALWGSFTKKYERLKNKSLKSGLVTHYNYSLWFQGAKSIHWSYEAHAETVSHSIHLIAKGENYPIGDDTCFITIQLSSYQLTFNGNFQVFDKLYESLEWIKDIT